MKLRGGQGMTYGVVKQRAKHITYEEYTILKDLSRAAKNLYNSALYLKRQDFFRIQAIRKSIRRANLPMKVKKQLMARKDLQLMSYNDLYHAIKTQDVYRVLNANMSQQILKLVDRDFKSFFGLLKRKARGDYKERVNLPNYLPKDGFFSLIVAEFNTSKGSFTLPMSRHYTPKKKITFNVPTILSDKKIKEIRVIPKQDARFFELQYVYEKEVSTGTYNQKNALAIDLGVNNLMTCTTNKGQSFIIDGKRIKSVNQYANKENARLKSILDKQGLKTSVKLDRLWMKRNNIIHDYLLKAARYVVNYCKREDIGQIVLGFNKDMTRRVNLGRKTNQFVASLPMGKIKDMLKYMTADAGIELHLQEESYTSKASFWDKDPLKKCDYSGERIKRGLYQTGDGQLLNADINGALNILRKSNVVDLEVLYTRGAVDTPQRIRLA